MPPLIYYLKAGWNALRNPKSFFDASWYLQENPDVASSKREPLTHYLLRGWRENRSPHPLFDPHWYLKANPDVEQAGKNPWLHYLMRGWREGRSPHPLFDGSWYLQKNPDVAVAGLNPLLHYLQSGWKEGRAPNAMFDGARYLEFYADVRDEGINPLVHYIKYGAHEGRHPHWLFDPQWYLEKNQDVAVTGANPLVHFVLSGWQEGRTPHPLFDIEWYLWMGQDVAAAGINPVAHYLENGWREGRKPHPLFDTDFYRDRYMAGSNSDEEPLRHFVIKGCTQGFDPNPLFDVSEYVKQCRDNIPSGINPLAHYIREGWAAGYKVHPLFDSEWYAQKYPDVAVAGLIPLAHFLSSGWEEGRNPGPFFSTSWYGKQYGDAKGVNPVVHYLQLAPEDERRPHPLFDPASWKKYAGNAQQFAADIFLHYLGAGITAQKSPGEVFDQFAATHGVERGALRFDVFVANVFEMATDGLSKAVSVTVDASRITDPHFEFLKQPADYVGKNVCLFAAYTPDGHFPDSTLHYIRNLRQIGLEILVVAATDRALSVSGLQMDMCSAVVIKDNHGYDFASWALMLTAIPSLWNANSITFANDSVFGPLSLKMLRDVHEAMLASEGDYVALTESFQVTHHFQSYFFMLKSAALKSSAVQNYWNSMESIFEKEKLIHKYEIGSLKFYKDNNISHSVIFPVDAKQMGLDLNPTLDIWRDLVEKGYPFLKVQLLRDKIDGVDASGWETLTAGNAELKRVIDQRLGSSHERRRTAEISR